MIKTLSLLHPWFVTGFTDGEGCFTINILINKKYGTGWEVQATFQIILHQKDLPLLELIKSYFSVGSIYKNRAHTIKYKVQSIKDLSIIIDHFNKYPLLTQKWADYLLFEKVFNLIKNKQHLTDSGLNEIVSIKASMNLGLSDKLNAAFPNIIPVDRPGVLNNKIQSPYWLAGFTSGEGSFIIKMRRSITHKMNEQVELTFQLTQHSRDEELMRNLIEYLGCGNVYRYEERVVIFKITKINDLTDKIIPLFQKYPIQGIKHLNFLDFVKVTEIMKEKRHLTEEGLSKIRKIKEGMNTGRE